MVRVAAVLCSVFVASALFGAAEGVKVTTDKTVDASSLESIVADVFRLSGAKSNDEKAIALYNYLHSAIFHNGYPTENKGQRVGPLKVLNVYGWGLCGGEHTLLKALFETAGWKCRFSGWDNPGHTTVETYYDGRWHYLDVFLKCYYWTKDKKTIASQEDIKADPSIALDGAKEDRVPKDSYLCCGDAVEAVVSGCESVKLSPTATPAEGCGTFTGRDVNYSPLLNLRSGSALKLEWNKVPGMMVADNPIFGLHGCGTKDFRNNPLLGPILEHYERRAYANGLFIYAPDFSKAADVRDIELTNAKSESGKLVASGQGLAIFKINLPYAYAAAKLDAVFSGNGSLAVSSDSGKTWQTAPSGDITSLVRQKYDVWVKAEFSGSLDTLALEATVQHNRGVTPYLVNGKNAITVSTKDNKLPEGCAMSITYAYQEATAPAKRNQYNGIGVTYGETKVVNKDIPQLPYTFEIEVGGNTPPKMISVERALKGK